MKTSKYIPTRSIYVSAIALVATTFAFAADPVDSSARTGNKAADKTSGKIDDYRANNSDVNKAEAKAAFAQIDAELDHLDKLVDAAPTRAEKDEARARYDALKDRRSQLKKEFNQARYDALKQDVKSETSRLTNWDKDRDTKNVNKDRDAKDRYVRDPVATHNNDSHATAVSVSSEKSAEKINEYRANPNDLNKAEVKAALARLDADIDLLDAKIGAVNDRDRKNQLKARLDGLKERRKELNSDFRKARYDALVDDVKSEWGRITD